MTEPCVIVLSGLPGSGKSTTARALAKRFDRSAHVEADRLHQMIARGAVLPDGLSKPQPGDEDEKQLRLRLEQACLMARTFVQHGFTAIVDDIVISDRLDQVIGHLGGLDTRFVMLSPTFESVRERWVAMDSPFADAWDWIEQERKLTDPVGLWLDTTGMLVGQVADVIVERLDEALSLIHI